MGRSTQVADLLDSLAGEDPEVVRRALAEFAVRDQAAALASRETGGNGGSLPGAATYYSVELDYTDLTDDGDNVTIWTPSAGDMIVAFALTWQNYTPWDHGPYLILGQNLNPGDLVPAGDPNDNNYWIYQDFTQALVPEFAYNYVSITETGGGGQGSQNSNYFVPAVGVPIKVQLVNNDGIPATQGHADFVFAVVTPTTP